MYVQGHGLAYFGMLRVGELTKGDHTVKAGNIHVGHNKDKLLITLYTSKTHGTKSGPQKIRVSAVTAGTGRSKGFFCPVQMVIEYMEIRGNYIEDCDQFFVFTDSSPVTPDHFRTLLRTLLKRVGLQSELYDVHSFRIGRTCDLAKFGYSIEQIKSMGRWKSNAVYKYLKN